MNAPGGGGDSQNSPSTTTATKRKTREAPDAAAKREAREKRRSSSKPVNPNNPVRKLTTQLLETYKGINQLYYQKKKGGLRRCKLFHLLKIIEQYKDVVRDGGSSGGRRCIQPIQETGDDVAVDPFSERHHGTVLPRRDCIPAMRWNGEAREWTA